MESQMDDFIENHIGKSQSTGSASSEDALSSRDSLVSPISPTMFDFSTKSGGVRRAAHKKHRTGCLTCKRRHVKCDEGKPHCQRCLSSNHDCEGYVAPSPIVRWRGASFRGFHIVNVNLAGSRPKKSAAPSAEQLGLEFFRNHTSKFWISYFPDGPWTDPLLAAQESHEVLRHCCVAVGSLHAAISAEENAISLSPDGDNSIASRRNFSLKQYTKALGLLRSEITSGKVNSQVVLLACIMLFIYECLQGQRKNLEVHLRHGLQLTKTQPKDFLGADLVSAILVRLRRLYLLYGRPRPKITSETARFLFHSLSQPFQEPQDLVSLRECVGDLGPSVQLFRGCVVSKAFPSDKLQAQARELIDKRTEVCLRALDTLEQRYMESGLEYKLAFRWLRMVSGLAVVFLKLSEDSGFLSFDDHVSSFQLIVDTTDDLLKNLDLEKDPTSMVFSIDLGFIATLFLTAVACRHPKVRRKAIDLLRRVPRKEGLWEAEVTAQAAEKVVEFEESHIAPEDIIYAEDPTHNFGIKQEFRVYDVDIRDVEPREGILGKMISLRLGRPHINEEGQSVDYFI